MKAIAVEELQPGMILARTVTNSDFVVVLSENTELSTAHITRLKFLDVPVVYIKDEFDLSKNYQQAAAVIKKDSAFAHDFENISKMAEEIFTAIEEGEDADRTTAKLAAHILPLADNSGSIDYLFNLGHMSSSVILHSERVSILAGVIAKWMRFNWEEIRLIVTAAFLHDVGKQKFPERLVGKNPDNLKGSDLQAYIEHCKNGYRILKTAKFAEPIPTVALQHHERMNGSGFPSALKGEAIHPFSRIVAVADAYDNLTSERPGTVKKTPFHAINYFVNEIYSNFDPVVCIPLLTRIKDSLIGSSIVLNDGRKGTVAYYPKDFSAMPIVVVEDGTEINLNLRKNISIAQYIPN